MSLVSVVDVRFPPPPRPPNPAAEKRGLRRIEYFAVVYFVVGVVGLGVNNIASSYYSGPVTDALASGTPDYSALAIALNNLAGFIELAVPVSLAVMVASLFILRSGLKSLSEVDKDNFHTPILLLLLEMVGLILVGLAIFPFVGALRDLASQLSSNPQGGLDASALLGTFALLVPGALISVVGFFGGEMLGVWRVGSRYDSGLTKAGAILIIFPYLQVLAPVLIFIGARGAMDKVASQVEPTTTPSQPSI